MKNSVELDNILKIDWIKRFSIELTPLLVSTFGKDFYKEMKKFLKKGFVNNLFIFELGKVTLYQSQKETDEIGGAILKKLNKDPLFCKKISSKVMEITDEIELFISKNNPNLKNYSKIRKLLSFFLPYYVIQNRIVDYLDENDSKNIKVLEKSRFYSEKTYPDVDDYLNSFLKGLSSQNNLYLTESELKKAHKNKFEVHNLKKQGLYYKNGKEFFLTKSDVDKFEKKFLSKKHDKKFVKGICANKGCVKGYVRLIKDIKTHKEFKKDEILVTGMTRPEYVPFMRQAKAIVTDVGGLLCHAAIVSREMNKPCIIGTQFATNVLKDGDLVEVDANHGVVKILKRGKNEKI